MANIRCCATTDSEQPDLPSHLLFFIAVGPYIPHVCPLFVQELFARPAAMCVSKRQRLQNDFCTKNKEQLVAFWSQRCCECVCCSWL